MKPSSAFLLFSGLLWAQLALAAASIVWGYPFVAFFLTLFTFACAVFFATTAYSALFGAPFVPMDKDRVEEMLAFAGVKAGEIVADLGAGDGRIVIAAARRGARAEGWEINPYLWLWAQWNIKRAGVGGRATVHLGSYWDRTFRDVDLVTLFLITRQMRRMQKKLRAELKPGSRVASYAFTFPDWELRGKSPHGIYLYVQE